MCLFFSSLFMVSSNDSHKSGVVVKNLINKAKKQIKKIKKDDDSPAMETSVSNSSNPNKIDDNITFYKHCLSLLFQWLDSSSKVKFGQFSKGELSGVQFNVFFGYDRHKAFTSSRFTTDYLTAFLSLQSYFKGTLEVTSDYNSQTCPPHLDTLAQYWSHPVTHIRNSIMKLLHMELSNLDTNSRDYLLDFAIKNENLVLVSIMIDYFHEDITSAELIRSTGLKILSAIESPESSKIDQDTAIQLIGAGFRNYQPYFEFSKVIHSLFKLKTESGKTALINVALSDPTSFIMTLSTEITRLSIAKDFSSEEYSLLSVKNEILVCIDLLLASTSLVRFLQQVLEIVLFCINLDLLKTESIKNIFPGLREYAQIESFGSRVIIGTTHGDLVVYETGKFSGAGHKFSTLLASQTGIAKAHGYPITAVAINSNGSVIACYSAKEAKISFWTVESGNFITSSLSMASSVFRKTSGNSGVHLKMKSVAVVRVTENGEYKEVLSFENEKLVVLKSKCGQEFRFMM